MHPLLRGVLRGDPRAVARALTIVENDAQSKRELLQSIYPYCGQAHWIGITGPPGVGKSSLVDQLITALRKQEIRIGVIAVDPSSPFTGGALLGDRVRMTRHSADLGVYIRSVGSRGTLGGLGRSTREMAYVLEASGCDVILLETVGVGQAELDVMSVADTVGLVLTPGAGDAVQTAKAGIMEIADLFIVNKCDLPGADALVRELQWMLHDHSKFRENWQPPVVRTVAADASGVNELWAALSRHQAHLREGGYWEQRRKTRHRAATIQLLEAAFRQYIEGKSQSDWRILLEDDVETDPYASFERIAMQLPWLHAGTGDDSGAVSPYETQSDEPDSRSETQVLP